MSPETIGVLAVLKVLEKGIDVFKKAVEVLCAALKSLKEVPTQAWAVIVVVLVIVVPGVFFLARMTSSDSAHPVSRSSITTPVPATSSSGLALVALRRGLDTSTVCHDKHYDTGMLVHLKPDSLSVDCYTPISNSTETRVNMVDACAYTYKIIYTGPFTFKYSDPKSLTSGDCYYGSQRKDAGGIDDLSGYCRYIMSDSTSDVSSTILVQGRKSWTCMTRVRASVVCELANTDARNVVAKWDDGKGIARCYGVRQV
jgi:hypothetical protein